MQVGPKAVAEGKSNIKRKRGREVQKENWHKNRCGAEKQTSQLIRELQSV